MVDESGTRRVLYAVDLDGTLLGDDARLSKTSRQILVELLADGLPLTAASARSVVAIRQLLAGLPLPLPVIEFNGAFLSDASTGEHLWTQAIEPGLAQEVYEVVRAAGHTPFVSTFDGQRDRLYAPPVVNPGMAWYVGDRQANGDERLTPVEEVSVGLADQVVCFTVIAEEEPLRTLEEQVRGRWTGQVQLHCQENRYFQGWFWLTVHDRRATKDQAVRRLLEQPGLQGAEVVAFGDEVNDLGLSDLAHRAVAVANAVPELKERADEVIGPNTEDSVARYLQDDWGRRRGTGQRRKG